MEAKSVEWVEREWESCLAAPQPSLGQVGREKCPIRERENIASAYTLQCNYLSSRGSQSECIPHLCSKHCRSHNKTCSMVASTIRCQHNWPTKSLFDQEGQQLAFHLCPWGLHKLRGWGRCFSLILPQMPLLSASKWGERGTKGQQKTCWLMAVCLVVVVVGEGSAASALMANKWQGAFP